MQLPPELRPVLDAIRPYASPRLVGGCVRDHLLGISSTDFDIEVPKISFPELQRILAPFGATNIIGRSFGVIKLRLNHREYDFSLPRRESKTGSGHRGFAITPDPTLTDAEAAARRDFTINSIAYDPFTDTLIDPHNGQTDLRNKILRHTSPAFIEDPLRVLRAFQLASRFQLTLAPETIALCRTITHTFRELPKERVWGEWAKWSSLSTKPSIGLRILEQTDWLQHFPPLAKLRGTPQEPDWHPEGDVFEHTAHVTDSLASNPDWQNATAETRRVLMLAALSHDLGKPATTIRATKNGQLRWTSSRHEQAGIAPAEQLLQIIGAPHSYAPQILPLILNHTLHHNNTNGSSTYTDPQIRRLARRIAPANIDNLCLIMAADAQGRPPRDPSDSLKLINHLRNRAHELAIQKTPPAPILQGRHLIDYGLKPGSHFKKILSQAFEAQLDGIITDLETAHHWLHLRFPKK